jgi:membrane associated rhomboid family serine protease
LTSWFWDDVTVIPFGDDQGGIRVVTTTAVVLLAIVGVYLYEWTLTPEAVKSLVADYGILAQQVSQQFQVGDGAGRSIQSVMSRGILPFITYPFLHSGPIHAASCALAFWAFGSRLESRTSWWRFLLFLVLSTVAGGLAQLQWGAAPDVVHLGATVPVGSVALAYLVLYPKARTRVLVLPLPLILRVPAVVSLAIFGVLQFHKIQDFFGLDCGVSLDYIPQAASVSFCGLVLGPLLLGWRRKTTSGSKTAKSKRRAPSRRGSYAHKR